MIQVVRAAWAVAMRVLVTIAGVGLLCAPAVAQPSASVAEVRARAIVSAFSSGDAEALERAAQANYSAAALARRTPAQRAQAVQTIHDGLGALEITNVTQNGDALVVTTHGAKGGDGTFTFNLGSAPERRIESVGVQTTGIQATPASARRDNPYAAYAYLIGDWDTTTSGGAMEQSIHQTLSWGPQNSYITYTIRTRDRGQAVEDIHQDGWMVFNASTNKLDFLFVHEPGSYGLEEGTVQAQPDGSIVRETTAIGGDGVITRFRQTFRQTGPNTAVTSLMRQNADGTWSPNFTGADNLIMTRRS